MEVLFINAAFRDGSRTVRLAEYYLQKHHSGDEVTRIELGKNPLQPLDADRLRIYNASVAARDFSHEMFDSAKQFARADVILIAAPFWNYGLPAVLNVYMELVCSQGVSFDMDEKGNYISLCRARKLVFFTTAGGPIPEPNCAFGLILQMCDAFWGIEDARCFSAQSLDIVGTDVERALLDACAGMD